MKFKHFSTFYFLIFSFSFLFSEVIIDTKKVTIEEVIEIAKKNSSHFEFKSSELDSKRKIAEFEYTSLLPRIDYKYQNGASTVNIAKGDGGQEARNINVNPEMQSLNVDFDISIHKIIPKLHAINLDQQIKSQDQNIFEYDFILEVTKLYLNLFSAQKIKNNTIEYKNTLIKESKIVKDQLEHGLNKTLNLNEVLKRLSAAETEEMKAENQLTNTQNEYLMHIGILHKDLVKPEIDYYRFANKAEYLDSVEKNNSKIKQLGKKNDLLMSKLILASMEFSPRVSLSYHNTKETQVWYYLGTPAVMREMMLLNVHVPILDSGNAIQKTADAYYQKQTGMLESSYVRKKILNDAEAAWISYQNMIKIHASQSEVLVQAKKNVELRKNEMELEMGNLYFLMEAENDYLREQNKMIDIEVNLIYQYFLLEFYTK